MPVTLYCVKKNNSGNKSDVCVCADSTDTDIPRKNRAQTRRPIRNQFPVAAAIDSVTPILHADFANRYIVPITAGYDHSFMAKLSVFLSL